MFESCCQRHEEPQKQTLKKKFKSNFQTMNKTRLCDSKKKNTKCAKQM